MFFKQATHQAIHCANYFANEVCHVADQTNQKRVQVQGIEYALYDRHQVAKSHNQFEINIHISNGDVNFLDINLHTSVDLNETCDLGVEVEIGFQLVDSEFNSANMKFWNTKKNIWGS